MITVGVYNSVLGGVERALRNFLPDAEVEWSIPLYRDKTMLLNPFLRFNTIHSVDLFWVNLPSDNHLKYIIECVLKWNPKPEYVVLVALRNTSKCPQFLDLAKLLYNIGYTVEYKVYDMCKYNVAQNRKRLVMRAVLHNDKPRLRPLKPSKKLGWFAVMKDIILDFPQTELSPMQKKLLGDDELPLGVLIKRHDLNYGIKPRKARQPSFTLTGGNHLHAFNVIDFDGVVRGCDIRGMKRLMGIPDDFYLPPNSLTPIARSIPSPFVEVILNSLIS